MSRVVAFGGSGLIGRELLEGLLADDEFHSVGVALRKLMEIQHPKAEIQFVDFDQPEYIEACIAEGDLVSNAGQLSASTGHISCGMYDPLCQTICRE